MHNAHRQLILALAFVGLVAGCSSQAPPAAPSPTAATRAVQPPSAAPASPPAVQQPPPASAPGGASPVAAPTAATAAVAARVEPAGKATLAFHTSISPQWFDPQENALLQTPYVFSYLMHDALVRPMPGIPNAPSLAESYEIAPDFKSATFKLRKNIKFHNGDPVTAEDVKFTFEKYRGANAKVLQDKTASIETPDPLTVKFTFKEPFLDFLLLYGTPSSGAGWIVPKKYYEQVGPDGFKQKPIGAGPYKFVSFSSGDTLETEAFTDYWRKSPSVKTFIIKAVPEESTRLAALQAGEVDMATTFTGPTADIIRSDPKLALNPAPCCSFWLMFPGFNKPESPFNNIKVRQAVGLALDRQTMVDTETGGLGPIEGNWIPEDHPGAIKLPPQPYDPVQAKKLMTEAGYPSGFDAGQITPLPVYFSLAERVATQLRQIGIQLRVNQMERGAYINELAKGEAAFGKGVILHLSGAAGDAASRLRTFALCPPKGVNSVICDPQIDQMFAKYEASTNAQERTQISTDIQRYIEDNRIFVTLYKSISAHAQGPRIANDPKEIWGNVLQFSFVAPYEDVRVKT